jgi:hypothetical protein
MDFKTIFSKSLRLPLALCVCFLFYEAVNYAFTLLSKASTNANIGGLLIIAALLGSTPFIVLLIKKIYKQ